MSVYDLVQVFGWSTTVWYLAGFILLAVTVFVVAVRRQNKRWRNEDEEARRG